MLIEVISLVVGFRMVLKISDCSCSQNSDRTIWPDDDACWLLSKLAGKPSCVLYFESSEMDIGSCSWIRRELSAHHLVECVRNDARMTQGRRWGQTRLACARSKRKETSIKTEVFRRHHDVPLSFTLARWHCDQCLACVNGIIKDAI